MIGAALCVGGLISSCVYVPKLIKSYQLRRDFKSLLINNKNIDKNKPLLKPLNTDKKSLSKDNYVEVNGLAGFVKEINDPKRDTNKLVVLASPKEETTVRARSYNIDLSPWAEVGILNPDPTNDRMPDEAINLNIGRIESSLLFVMACFIVFFVFPWIVLRSVCWIISADAIRKEY